MSRTRKTHASPRLANASSADGNGEFRWSGDIMAAFFAEGTLMLAPKFGGAMFLVGGAAMASLAWFCKYLPRRLQTSLTLM